MTGTPEFSRPLRLDQVGSGGRTAELSATPAERAALAARFELLELTVLSASLEVEARARGTQLRAIGRIRATLTQACVATLEPVPQTIDEAVELRFGPLDEPSAEIEVLDEEPLEPIVDGTVDLGEAVVQKLSELIDPFPRLQGAEFASDPEPPGKKPGKKDEPAKKPHPFAALERLKKL